MPYVSAKFTALDLGDGTIVTDELIQAIDDQGRVWSVPGIDCQVGDWLEFLAQGGSVEPYKDEPEPA